MFSGASEIAFNRVRDNVRPLDLLALPMKPATTQPHMLRFFALQL